MDDPVHTDGRLRELERKAEEARQEWIRAERAEAEVAQLRALIRDIRAFHAGHTGLNAANYWWTIEERIDAALGDSKE